MTALPQSKANDLIDRLNEMRTEGKYLDPSQFQWRLLQRECERVRQVEPAVGWTLLGMLYATAGNVDEVNACFERACKISSLWNYKLNWCSSLSALGYYSDAQALLPDILRPEGGGFGAGFLTGLELGAFKMIRDHISAARELGLDLSAVPVEMIEQAAAIMDEAGISDKDVARHMDAAGAVLRDHKVFDMIRGEILTSKIEGGLTGITMVLRVTGTAGEVFQLNKDLARKERQLAVKKSEAFDVLIASTN